MGRPSPHGQARRDQALTALREAEPWGLFTSEVTAKVTEPCCCVRSIHGANKQPWWQRDDGSCSQCDGRLWRPMIGSALMATLYALERLGLVEGFRAKPGSGAQVLWRLSPVGAEQAAATADLDEHWRWLADQADDA